jgi:hypothetical protein
MNAVTIKKLLDAYKRYQGRERSVEVSCFRCGWEFMISEQHVRVYNYCGNC